MRKTFTHWKADVETMLRNRHRQQKGQPALSSEQEKEEIEEVERFKKQFYGHCIDDASALFEMVTSSNFYFNFIIFYSRVEIN